MKFKIFQKYVANIKYTFWINNNIMRKINLLGKLKAKSHIRESLSIAES